MNRITAGLVFTAIVCWAQPVIESAENAAGLIKAGLPNSALAQGSLVVIKGRNLGQRTLVQSLMPLPLDLAGTSAQITVGASTLAMPVNYVTGTSENRTQISVVVPSNTPAGLGSLRVTYQGQTSPAFPVTITRTSFGIFTINSAGTGAAVAFTGSTLNTAAESLRPGAVAQIFGTGLGPVPYADRIPAEAGNLNVDVEVWLGSKRAEITYQGRVPEIASVDQINFIVPPDTPPGCEVSLLVRAGGVVSNATTVPVAAAGGLCSDPVGYPPEVLARASKGLKTGIVSLTKSVSITAAGGMGARNESLTGVFQFRDYTQVLSYPGTGPSLGSCAVQSFDGRAPLAELPVPQVGLDAGASLTVSGPNGSHSLDRQPQQPGVYRRLLNAATGGSGGSAAITADFLSTGRLTASGPGGGEVGTFSASLMWPGGFNWVVERPLNTIPRSQDLEIRWEGASAEGYVTITGESIGGTAAAPVGARFTCRARASAGSFVVPAVVLQQLPASQGYTENSSTGSLTVGASGLPVPFVASGLDYGALNYTAAFVRNVRFD